MQEADRRGPFIIKQSHLSGPCLLELTLCPKTSAPGLQNCAWAFSRDAGHALSVYLITIPYIFFLTFLTLQYHLSKITTFPCHLFILNNELSFFYQISLVRKLTMRKMNGTCSCNSNQQPLFLYPPDI